MTIERNRATAEKTSLFAVAPRTSFVRCIRGDIIDSCCSNPCVSVEISLVQGYSNPCIRGNIIDSRLFKSVYPWQYHDSCWSNPCVSVAISWFMLVKSVCIRGNIIDSCCSNPCVSVAISLIQGYSNPCIRGNIMIHVVQIRVCPWRYHW